MKCLFALYLLFAAHSMWASTPDTAGVKNVVISGSGFIFNIKQPVDWVCNTASAPDYKANAILYMNDDSLKSGGALIQLAVFYKQDEFTDKDLEEDVNSYKNKYGSTLHEADVDIKHPIYRTYGKLEYVPGDFYQYIIYLNPGQEYKYGLSAAMNVYKREATPQELATFKALVSTMLMIRG